MIPNQLLCSVHILKKQYTYFSGVLSTQGDITTSFQKNITLSQGTLKVIPQSPVLTPGVKTVPSPNVTVQKPSDVQLQRQGSAVSVGNLSYSQGSPSTVSMVTKTVTVAASSASLPVTAVSTSQSGSTSPLVARLVQQMSGIKSLAINTILESSEVRACANHIKLR